MQLHFDCFSKRSLLLGPHWWNFTPWSWVVHSEEALTSLLLGIFIWHRKWYTTIYRHVSSIPKSKADSNTIFATDIKRCSIMHLQKIELLIASCFSLISVHKSMINLSSPTPSQRILWFLFLSIRFLKLFRQFTVFSLYKKLIRDELHTIVLSIYCF